MRTYYGKTFAVPLALKSRSHLSVHRIWLLTQTALSHSEDAALFPGGGEDRYSRGGPSQGRLSCRQPRIYGNMGRARLSTLACPRPAAPVPPVTVRPAVSRWAGDGVRRFAIAGVAVQVRGGSVIFDPLTDGLRRMCRLGKCPGSDAVTGARRAPLEGSFREEMALLLALVEWKYIRKNSATSRGGWIEPATP